jgi:hypothetical protein
MTNQDQVNFIRQKCVEANPEIVVLKFGCEVIGNIGMAEYLNDPFIVIGLTSVCKKHKKYHVNCGAEENGCAVSDGIVVKWGSEEDGWGEHTLKESESGKIIGRPIRLADIFVTVVKKNGAKFGNLGKTFDALVEAQFVDVARTWRLNLDDLQTQSEETINFLYELLQ